MNYLSKASACLISVTILSFWSAKPFPSRGKGEETFVVFTLHKLLISAWVRKVSVFQSLPSIIVKQTEGERDGSSTCLIHEMLKFTSKCFQWARENLKIVWKISRNFYWETFGIFQLNVPLFASGFRMASHNDVTQVLGRVIDDLRDVFRFEA